MKKNIHNYPQIIENEVITALSFYPELKNTQITFKFRKNIKKSTMLSQPTIKSFFRPKKYRSYQILISEKFKISDNKFLTKDLPSNVLIGWIGHELGHIIDYKNRSHLNLISFGIQYLFSDHYIKHAERRADTHAVRNGMRSYILDTKNFIINHADIPQYYKDHIEKYYLSPEEIMEIVEHPEEILDKKSIVN
ncbi:hypothetical protein [Urechidicola croceus]|uniref:Uncharacterized protein n=1 Tax=Urechidicola croceus TaxID=1850246 RepID=A0A1D8P404_9FLAO|nr:hypothetical protein [Urechidicola croceus]AOW19305.1 hypothetical protein LPB138_00790 [Urechidicola croceus]